MILTDNGLSVKRPRIEEQNGGGCEEGDDLQIGAEASAMSNSVNLAESKLHATVIPDPRAARARLICGVCCTDTKFVVWS